MAVMRCLKQTANSSHFFLPYRDNVDCLTIELFDRDGMNIGDLLYSMNMVHEKQKLIPDRKTKFAPA